MYCILHKPNSIKPIENSYCEKYYSDRDGEYHNKKGKKTHTRKIYVKKRQEHTEYKTFDKDAKYIFSRKLMMIVNNMHDKTI